MDNMNQTFQDEYNKIAAPQDLKADTLTKMLEENKKINRENATLEKQKKKGKAPVLRYGGVAAAAFVAAMCLIVLHPTGAVYVTPMEEGEYYQEIELKDGTIYFVENRVAISISPNAGLVVIGQETQDTDEKENDQVILEQKTENGGMLVLKEVDEVQLPEITEKNWSCIGEQNLYVTVLKTDGNLYQAVYEKDGRVLEVIGIEVSQKEFVDFLYQQVKE